MEIRKTEQHPLGFFLPENTKLLMLGSFPPQKIRWSMNFYYPNFQNDMWRIMGLIFYSDKNHFVDVSGKAYNEAKARAFCHEKGIGLGDTALEVIRLKDNASDKFLEVVTPINLKEVLDKVPECEAIVVTGQKAMDTLVSILPLKEPKVGFHSSCYYHERDLKVYRMPSSSRAYPKPLSEKAEDYKKMFLELNIIP
ncbi:G:T/U-mismatch repair DNA glycosylase [Parabacteroides sp. PF5-5]|uniref:uracil-DNA glycosylase family protein n=1 Tax=unclassified Parabacteroides TaxID=2649774 RepID=UPI0024766954|nr:MULTISPECIES: uracil-DNA glycosylase family protein [unclassified Parabacteroides]MDH6306652.1 G:T/U-mismatch repair DNA glycosylase [Parabacteroides sp. PH5-39]MDH6317619.1 G:T/U-mismatch repair DNA glycosylase [Parabacteroides sp. PF5-13]MDH6321363.1 G:T/U-mismatch repair DNA glycosylase [Parabacteroides sp. PH5-13]MDH6325072.1 G:T/U-mismatch repair DNA glycosylase [Parabacteroides sp. PH5-8]MDH6328781.1 G:T/U-mismatch repair DNA glycosylase [Parabacteroides sp. PH5-41]